ncbi:MAG: tetratricopeptide repeat protein [Phenylobacterium sp.]|nr:MAG: tetratricopeptide repeat protein [Phenylobacterium sp.]
MKIVAGAAGMIAAAMMFGAAGQASAQVDVSGDGFAKACSDAAKAGESANRFEQLCTASLEHELLIPRDRAGTYVNRGIIRMRGKAYDEAIRDFDTAIRYQSNLGEAYVNRGAARIGTHRFVEAVSDFNNALELGVKEPEKTYYNRALAYEWLDNYKAAYLDYRKALELAPDWDVVNQQLARFTVSHADVATPAATPTP